MMKILHVVEDFSLNSGGLRTVIKDLNSKLLNNNFVSKILSSNKEKEDLIYLVNTKKPWLYSNKWMLKLKELHNKYNFDVFHIHGVWMYPQFISAKFCIANNIPFIVSVHGMYEPWLWEKGTFKKKIYFNFLVKNKFKKAACIHAITPQEKNNLTALFKLNKIIEIPNLIHPSKLFNKDENNKEKYIFYLGRLDKKKGIELLITAFSKIDNDNIKLKIAGKINNYKSILDVLVSKYGLSNKIEFLGLVSGSDKQKLISNAQVLVAPSFSEVIGMVNLEAAILKTPVITTYQTGLKPELNINGGRLINPNVNELEKALNEVLNWTKEERKLNKEKIFNFVIENYSWSKKFKDWSNLYQSCIK